MTFDAPATSLLRRAMFRAILVTVILVVRAALELNVLRPTNALYLGLLAIPATLGESWLCTRRLRVRTFLALIPATWLIAAR